MDLKFGDIQETALIPLAIKASETSRPNARIRDLKAKEIIDIMGPDGGYMFATSASVDQAERRNMEALFQTIEDYGKS